MKNPAKTNRDTQKNSPSQVMLRAMSRKKIGIFLMIIGVLVVLGVSAGALKQLAAPSLPAADQAAA